ncbi:MAG: efflux RND transporter periplasmic adaptor subunit [Longimonas sp.]|uniref:efflux RND transporter periplasmic adaptor subunit n=1 Tax=Longimonas sp. TaxID=2039626 RepID=UPI003362D9B9
MPRRLPFFALLAALVLWTGCTGDDLIEPEDQGVPVDVLETELQTFRDRLDLTGALDTDDDATLSAQAAGTLQSREALGTTVGAGAVVARIDPAQARAAVRQAEAQLRTARSAYELAQDNFERQEPLYRDSVISAIEFENVRSQLDQAEAQVDQAEAAVEQAQDQLDNTTVRAPFAGTVEQHFAKTGEQLSPGMPVLRMVSTERMHLQVGVPERYINDIDPDAPVDVRFRALGDAVLQGSIRFVGRTVDARSRTFNVEVELENGDQQLHPDMVGRVLMPRQQLDDVVVVPRRAVERDEDGHRMYVVVDADSDAPRIESRLIRMGPTSQGRTVVLDGLSAGELVVVTGQSNVADGDRPRIMQRHASLDDAMLDPASTRRPVADTR